eukprot:966538-Amphidinium_carterae.1
MYRALSPSAEENMDMDISTPKGTGGLSPPPAIAGARLDRPPGAALLAQASLGAGVRTEDVHRTVESTAALGAGGEAPDTWQGGPPIGEAFLARPESSRSGTHGARSWS